jgi:hypothetical protein
MSNAVLATKLHIPPPRPKTAIRPRLIERLNEGLSASRKLTLISAPAGFGKTTLVSEWVAVCERPIAWLSLDEADNDPTCFLACLVAALQTIAANIGAGVLRTLQSPQPTLRSAPFRCDQGCIAKGWGCPSLPLRCAPAPRDVLTSPLRGEGRVRGGHPLNASSPRTLL